MRYRIGSRLVRRVLPLLLVVVVVLATVPEFFWSYRNAAFDTFPRDDYAPYLLALTGDVGDGPNRNPEFFQGAPMAHRPLSVVAALPAYHLLPLYAFSNLEDVDEPYLRATAALAFVGWISMLLTALLIYAIARHRLRCAQVGSYIAALLTLIFYDLVEPGNVDSMAIFLVALLVYFIDRPLVVVPLVLLSVVVNEKVMIIASVLTGSRLLAWVSSRRTWHGFRYWPQLVASGVAFIAYVLFRRVFLPLSAGEYEGQLDPTTWPAKALETIELTLSLKGFVTNGVPLIAMALVVYIAWVMAPRVRPASVSFERADVLVFLALIVTAAAIGMRFTVPRLVLHAFPLYLPMVAVLVGMFVRSRVITKPLDAPRSGGR